MMRRSPALLSIVAALAVAACGTSETPTVAPTQAPTESTAPGASPTLPAATLPAPTLASLPPSETPATPAATVEPTVGPASSQAPSVDSLSVQRTADCTSDNGTGTVGYIRITWTASGTTGVRLSIDPPSADTAYAYGYADYPASGFADVPFACDPPNHDAKGDYHLYVVTTLHTKGSFFYRFARVYAATP